VIEMCNYCEWEEMEKCSIKGYLLNDFCCEKCTDRNGTFCAKLNKDVSGTYDISDPKLITQIFDQLEAKIKTELSNYKEIILSKAKKEVIIR